MKGLIHVKIKLAIPVVVCLALFAATAYAWEKNGIIPGTELAFEELGITKKGVSVRLVNTSHTPIRVSMRLNFYDERANSLGYTILGLREIPPGSYVNIAENHLNGSWRKCREAYRAEWRPMTYELVYE